MGRDITAHRPRALPPGYDEKDPYEGVDIEELPEWWRKNVLEFREYSMRPYRPPRFEDGIPTPTVVSELAEKYDITIRFETYNPHEGDRMCEVVLNGEPIATVPRRREAGGYNLYEIHSDEFRTLVHTTLTDDL